jgi:hypothetical protein
MQTSDTVRTFGHSGTLLANRVLRLYLTFIMSSEVSDRSDTLGQHVIYILLHFCVNTFMLVIKWGPIMPLIIILVTHSRDFNENSYWLYVDMRAG